MMTLLNKLSQYIDSSICKNLLMKDDSLEVLGTCLSTIERLEKEQEEFLDKSDDSSFTLLESYGFLQSCFVQQDCLEMLIKKLNKHCCLSIKFDNRKCAIREIRNQLVGHPISNKDNNPDLIVYKSETPFCLNFYSLKFDKDTDLIIKNKHLVEHLKFDSDNNSQYTYVLDLKRAFDEYSQWMRRTLQGMICVLGRYKESLEKEWSLYHQAKETLQEVLNITAAAPTKRGGEPLFLPNINRDKEAISHIKDMIDKDYTKHRWSNQGYKMLLDNCSLITHELDMLLAVYKEFNGTIYNKAEFVLVQAGLEKIIIKDLFDCLED